MKEASSSTPFGAVKQAKPVAPQPVVDEGFITYTQQPAVTEPIAPSEPEVSEVDDDSDVPLVGEIPAADETPPASVDEASEETEEDDSPNPYEFLGNQLKSDGFIDDEFSVTKKVKGQEVYQAYQEKLRKEIEPQIYNEVRQKLEDAGVNENDLRIALLLRQGVDVYTLQNEGIRYEKLSVRNPEASEDEKVAKIEAMYQTKGYADKDYKIVIEKAREEGKLDELDADASTFFEEKNANWSAQKLAEKDQEKQMFLQTLQKNAQLVQTKLVGGEIYGDKIDKKIAEEINRAIFAQEDFYELPDGKRRPVAKFQKFIDEFNDNVELRVWAYKKFAYRDKEVAAVKKNVEKEVEKEFISAYKNSVKKNVPNKVKEVKQTNAGQSAATGNTGKVWSFDFSSQD